MTKFLNIKLLVILILCNTALKAQVSESFEYPECLEESIQSCTNLTNEGWFSTHGAPLIVAEGQPFDNVEAADGSYYAYMAIGGVFNQPFLPTGMGIALENEFIENHSYDISFMVRGSGINLEVILSNDVIPCMTSCNSSGGGDHPLVPTIPNGSNIIESFYLNSEDNWQQVTISIDDLDANFDQIWFRAINPIGNSQTPLFIDDFGIQEIECEPFECKENNDLTACQEEGDYGFIFIQCAESFEWTLPANSQAIELTNGINSAILNAGEGLYTVTVTDAEGCTEVLSYEVVADCCDPKPSCEASVPENLRCETKNGTQTRLVWDPVPGATGYAITIEVNAPKCCPNGVPYTINTPSILDNYYNISSTLQGECFLWSVAAFCKDGGMSFYEEACFDPSVDCTFLEGCTCDNMNNNCLVIHHKGHPAECETLFADIDQSCLPDCVQNIDWRVLIGDQVFEHPSENALTQSLQNSVLGFEAHGHFAVVEATVYLENGNICTITNNQLIEDCGFHFGNNEPSFRIENNSSIMNNKKYENLIYPNPIKIGDVLYIQKEVIKNAENVEILNSSGKLVTKLAPEKHSLQIDSSWKSGLYLIKVLKDQELTILKFVIQ